MRVRIAFVVLGLMLLLVSALAEGATIQGIPHLVGNTLTISFGSGQTFNVSAGGTVSIQIQNITLTNITEANSFVSYSGGTTLDVSGPKDINGTAYVVNGEHNFTVPGTNYKVVPPKAVKYVFDLTPNISAQTGGQSFLPNVTVNYAVAPIGCNATKTFIPSWTNSIIISNATCGYSFTVNAIPKLGINVTVNASHDYFNSTYGIEVRQSQNTTSKANMIIGLGQEVTLPLLNGTAVTVKNAYNSNNIDSNTSLLTQIFSAHAGQGCMPGALMSLEDSETGHNITFCTKPVGAVNYSIFQELPAYDLAVSNLTVGLGQAFYQVHEDDVAYYTPLLAAANKNASMWYSEAQSYKEQNYINYTNLKSANASVNGGLAVAIVLVAGLISVFLVNRYMARKNRRAPYMPDIKVRP